MTNWVWLSHSLVSKAEEEQIKSYVILTGFGLPSLIFGAGKTQYALAHGKRPLLITKIDDLLRVRSGHDLIVFDDMLFTDLVPDDIIHLLYVEMDRNIKCRCRNALLPAVMRRRSSQQTATPRQIPSRAPPRLTREKQSSGGVYW